MTFTVYIPIRIIQTTRISSPRVVSCTGTLAKKNKTIVKRSRNFAKLKKSNVLSRIFCKNQIVVHYIPCIKIYIMLLCGEVLGKLRHLCLLAIHCKDSIPKIRNTYFQKRNCSATVPVSTFMCLWAIYIFPRSICLFCCRKICGPILGIYNSLTDTRMWKLRLRPRNT
jgi:hypothetical protein